MLASTGRETQIAAQKFGAEEQPVGLAIVKLDGTIVVPPLCGWRSSLDYCIGMIYLFWQKAPK